MFDDGIDEMCRPDRQAGDLAIRDPRLLQYASNGRFNTISHVWTCSRRLVKGYHSALGGVHRAEIENDGICVCATDIDADTDRFGDSDRHTFVHVS